jgi:hypothetical protein
MKKALLDSLSAPFDCKFLLSLIFPNEKHATFLIPIPILLKNKMPLK